MDILLETKAERERERDHNTIDMLCVEYEERTEGPGTEVDSAECWPGKSGEWCWTAGLFEGVGSLNKGLQSLLVKANFRYVKMLHTTVLYNCNSPG